MAAAGFALDIPLPTHYAKAMAVTAKGSTQASFVLACSITELAQYATLAGDLLPGGFSPERAQEGTRQHRRLQGEYPQQAFTAEVPLFFEQDRGGYTLRLTGRADGLLQTEQGPRLIEIKTTEAPPAELSFFFVPAYAAQLLIYAYLYCKREGLAGIACELLYYHLGQGESFSFCQYFTLTELEERFFALLERYGQLLDAKAQALMCRNTTAGELAFPFEKYRKNQRALVTQVYTCLTQKAVLFAEAPTGTGKTMSALFPAVKAQGEGKCDRVFYLTAKGQTGTVALAAAQVLQQKGWRGRAILLTGREKCCLLNQPDCEPLRCPYAQGFYNRLHGARMALFAEPVIDLAFLRTAGERYQLCPFELGLYLAEDRDVIIADYNYLFDPAVRLQRFFERKTRHALLIDEAHNLPGRVMDTFSAALGTKLLRTARRACKEDAPLYRLLGKLLKSIQQAACLELSGGAELPPGLEAAEEVVNGLNARGQAGLLTPPEAALLRPLLDFIKAVRYFSPVHCRVLCDKNELQILCLDPAPHIREGLQLAGGAVLFSATLTPREYYTELCGMEDAYYYSIPSPFLPDNLLVLCDPALRTDYRAREQTAPAVARLIAKAAGLKRGNYLCFFPSYRYLQQVKEFLLLEPGLPPVMEQPPNMDAAAREAFLNAFTEGEAVLGLAVMGGHFGEGIDLPGDRLIGAFIVGVGLPQVSPERNLAAEIYAERGLDGFLYAYAYPGINRVLQAAGRVIRTEEDRGFVYLIDARYTRPPYSELLPPHWQVRYAAPEAALLQLERFWR